jgi:voltage-gated potassium channel
MADLFHRATQKMVDQIAKDPFIGAWRAVAVISLTVTLVGGILVRITDPDNFSSIWEGLWWSIQTVTTVGYGDIVPSSTAGRIVATVVMIGGIGFITVTTAAIASAFVEAARQRREGPDDAIETEIRELRTEISGLAREIQQLRAVVGERGTEPPK